MFDDERPSRISAGIWVASYDTTRLVCARCCSEVLQRDVALYSRMRPGDSFDPWCHACARVLVRWALAGSGVDADELQETDEEMVDAVLDMSQRGSFENLTITLPS